VADAPQLTAWLIFRLKETGNSPEIFAMHKMLQRTYIQPAKCNQKPVIP